ncbi:PUA-like domain-containing protein [Hypoxylon rubiginosum]|uniref:PUA-like domain-containing protein n=1 Tax=Hypoxylon rubiginosum TaxID=110542 RepID=A0ACC0CYA1_9PEZI|nr:PUA-like domain-containing protein [Hypoxylon rubiginosum]
MATIKLFAVGHTKAQQTKHMTEQSRGIYVLGMKSHKQLGRAAKPEDGQHYEALLEKGRLYLQWLDTIEMTPEIKEKRRMAEVLEYIIDHPKFKFPDDMVASAINLRNKWEAENWGSDAVIDEDGDSMIQDPDETLPDTPAATSSPQAQEQGAPIVQSEVPPSDHPIYGEEGIMHGVLTLRTSTGRKVYRLNPLIPQKRATVFGHNGIPVGTWYANQLVALHRGAHGSRMGGIAGNMADGAHSIVVSNNYDDLDQDHGDKLYYSGPNSHKNTDKTRPAPSAKGTKALKSSLQNRRPVRVLRSGGAPNTTKANPWLPDCGLRYDGLYRVVALRERINKEGKW